MDDRRFDSWTRKIAASTSRRSVVKGIAGALVGAIFGASRASETDAAGGYLYRGQRCSMSTAPCGPCLVCIDGRCAAATGDSRCSDTACGVCQNGLCRPSTERCGDCEHCTSALVCKSTCDGDDQVCCDGRCRPRGTCCQDRNDCDYCQMCENGQCITDPHEEGKQCSSCKRCKNGACSEEDPKLLCNKICCEEGQVCADNECCDIHNVCNGFLSQHCCNNGNVCTQDDGCCLAGNACGVSDGGYGHGQHKVCCDSDKQCIDNVCCPHDRSCIDRCCPEGTACQLYDGKDQCCVTCGNTHCCGTNVCITDGAFCCDTSINQACGDNGDGTFQQCCSGQNEECCEGKCVPKGCCNHGSFTAASDVCCDEGHAHCNGGCCPNAGQNCCGTTCCDGPCDETGSACCPADQICGDQCCDGPCDETGSACCPGDRICSGGCCADGEQCCNGMCQSAGEDCACPDAQICEGVGVPGDCCEAGQYCCADGCCGTPCSPDGNCLCQAPSYAQCTDDTGCCSGEHCCAGQCCQGTCVHYDTFDACCEVSQTLCSGNDGCCDAAATCCYSDKGLECCNLSVYECDKTYGCHLPFPPCFPNC